jgi:hypothetical protein
MAGTDWRSRAACARRPDLNWFDIDCCLEACLDVCRSCPETDTCIAEAITVDADEGVWGGLWGYGLRVAVRAGRR